MADDPRASRASHLAFLLGAMLSFSLAFATRNACRASKDADRTTIPAPEFEETEDAD